MTEHRIGTQQEWQAERDELLKEEKELTRRGDELARRRRELPWIPVEKDYRFETEDGTKTLADLLGIRCNAPIAQSSSALLKAGARSRLRAGAYTCGLLPRRSSPACSAARRSSLRAYVSTRVSSRSSSRSPSDVASWLARITWYPR